MLKLVWPTSSPLTTPPSFIASRRDNGWYHDSVDVMLSVIVHVPVCRAQLLLNFRRKVMLLLILLRPDHSIDRSIHPSCLELRTLSTPPSHVCMQDSEDLPLVRQHNLAPKVQQLCTTCTITDNRLCTYIRTVRMQYVLQ